LPKPNQSFADRQKQPGATTDQNADSSYIAPQTETERPEQSDRSRAQNDGNTTLGQSNSKPPQQNEQNRSGSKTEQGGVEGCAAHHTTSRASYI
jgi:hypothetical protein